MGITPSSSGRQMKNNAFSVQHSDEIVTKSISRAHDNNYARGLELLVHFQIGLFSGFIGGFSYGFFRWVLLVAFF